MAVVFISPKQRQKTFFLGITIVVLLFLFAVSLGVFLAKPKEIEPILVFNKPKVNVDMKVFDSDQFKNLQPFSLMQNKYSYRALNQANRLTVGFATADSIEKARENLEELGLEILELKEVEIGRENPFVPYY